VACLMHDRMSREAEHGYSGSQYGDVTSCPVLLKYFDLHHLGIRHPIILATQLHSLVVRVYMFRLESKTASGVLIQCLALSHFTSSFITQAKTVASKIAPPPTYNIVSDKGCPVRSPQGYVTRVAVTFVF
jgi:hypothetical protein